MKVMKYKKLYLVISVAVLIPGIISMLLFGLKLSVDFTGGSTFKYSFDQDVDKSRLISIFEGEGVDVETISMQNGNEAEIRTKPLENDVSNSIKQQVVGLFPGAELVSSQTVGPAVGKETTKNAFIALGWASLAILLYISYAFRGIPKPYSSFRFGASAIIAMLHDAFLVLGIFSLLGHYAGIEVDALFMTAVLTVIGFSVHDSIVVFDRIRENLRKLPKSWNFEKVVNHSIVETLSRSISTSLTVIITLASLYILGGETIKTFVLALLVGIISGTYSSIFTASPFLVLWEDRIFLRKHKKSK